MAATKTGLEVFLETPLKWADAPRIGLLANPASVDSSLNHARALINAALPGRLTALFSPQHGFFAEKQDNMIESDHTLDPLLNIPVFSLYGETRVPTKEMFDHLDLLLIDIQDVGTRVYTFMYTVSYCLEAAGAYNKKVVILDRPNPVGGVHTEGNILLPEYSSFVGRYPIPMRHGLTIGELALLFNSAFDIHADLTVVPMEGWDRKMYFEDTGLPWIAPSPNLPTPSSALVYPGQVIWEGTNISEGRGTTQPFELFGAPFLDTERMEAEFNERPLPGVFLRPAAFEPTSGKWKEQVCRGFQMHVTDRDRYRPYLSSLRLLESIVRLHGESFSWKQPPYEYEYEKLPMDLILGSRDLRKDLENGRDPVDMTGLWEPGLEEYEELRRGIHLYE